MHLKYLLGWEGVDKGKTPSFIQPGGQVLNAFQIQEMNKAEAREDGYMKLRDNVEKNLFPEYGDKEKPEGKERPVYGSLNMLQSLSGGADTASSTYGKTVIVLKEHVKKQCTYSLDDTFFIEKFELKKENRAALNLNETLVQESMRREKEQTDTVSDDQLVEQIEKAIRDNPTEFPLLTKYYLNAE